MTLFIILYIVGVIVAYPILRAGVIAVELLDEEWTLRNRIGVMAWCSLSWLAFFVGAVMWWAGSKSLDKKVKW